jgi:RNA polymerase sigma factor (sigma-70 family)
MEAHIPGEAQSMLGMSLHTVLNHLRRLHGDAEAAGHTDRELLRAFAAYNDQDAFAAVVTRHAALVWSVCRRILGHHQDAEDAFQATFLILARRAGSTRWRASVGGYLYTVAQRLAVRSRQRRERRRSHERQASRTPKAESSLRELAAVVDEELRRLPAKYRDPLLLHYLEGATAEAAARQLGLSRAAFYNRLTRAREQLSGRLSRQGLSLTAPLLVAALTQEAEAAEPSLIQATLRGAMGSAPPRAASLAAEALGNTLVTKLKLGLALGLLLSVAAGGVALWTPAPMPLPPHPERPAEPPRADDKAARRVDRYDYPLPPGALARLGTLRFRAPAEIQALALAPDDKILAVSSRGGLYLFDAISGQRLRRLPSATPEWLPEDPIVFSPDGKRLAGKGHKIVGQSALPVVRVWDVAGGRRSHEYDIGQWIQWLGWSSEGQPLALRVEDNGSLHLHDLAAGRSRRFECKDPLRYPAGSISRDPPVACSPAGRALAVPDDKNVVHVWDTATGRERCTLQPKGNFAYSVDLSPDGSRLVSGTSQTIQMWDATSGKVLYTVDSKDNYRSPRFSADGKLLVVADS